MREVLGKGRAAGVEARAGAPGAPYARVASGTRCVVDFVAPVANTADEAEGCITATGFAAVPADEVEEHAWQTPDADCRLNGGTFQAAEGDVETCAKALCACPDPVLDAPCP